MCSILFFFNHNIFNFPTFYNWCFNNNFLKKNLFNEFCCITTENLHYSNSSVEVIEICFISIILYTD